MPRQGLTQQLILQKAIELINRWDYKKLSFTNLSLELNVKPPAMFKHFKNLAALKEKLALDGIKMLKQSLQDSVTGKSGEVAFSALCHAYRKFAWENKGLYLAIQPSYFAKNKEIEQAAIQLMNIIISVLKGFNVAEEIYIHFLRVIRSSLHGFVIMEIEFHFGVPASMDISFEHQINALLLMIKSYEH